MKKKGQLTIFIIMGILLLLVIALVLYATREQITAPVEEERIAVQKVAVEAQPVQDFVQTCLYTVAKDGLELLGARGGYVQPTQRFNPYEPTAGEAVQFAPDSKLTIPYWWHLSAHNKCRGDCTFTSERPSIESIEHQLNDYLKKELPKCFGTFAQFRQQQVLVSPTGLLTPETRITRGNVIVQLTYPLEVSKTTEVHTLNRFVAELPVNFFEIYTLATNITTLEAEFSFLEQATRALIDAFSRTSESALPPVTEMEFGFGMGTTWTKYDVQQKLAELLTSYIPLLKVTYTRNYRYLPSPAGKDKEFYEMLYNRGFTIPVLEPHKSLTVKFAYLPWWKPYIDLNCNGQLCQSEGFSSTLGFLFGVRRYNFAYDTSYPVLVEISNPDAYGGEGYTFRYFLEANMRNNKALAALEPPLPTAQLPDRSTMLCDETQRTGGDLTLNVRTSAGTPVDKAQIIFRCDEETCYLGESTAGQLVTSLPRCIGGFLGAHHAQYASAVKPIDVLDETPKTADLIMPVGYPVDFAVKKWLLRKYPPWSLDTSAQEEQGPRENTVIMLERKGQPFEESITVFGDVCGSPFAKAPIPCGNPPSDHSQDVIVYAGDYHVTLYSFQYPSPDLVIPPDKRCVTYEIGPHKRKKCYWVPRTPILFNTKKPLLSGYAEYDWSVTDEALQHAKTIEFSYINFALDKVQPKEQRKIEDLEVMGNLFEYSTQYEELLMPRILR